ncbi:MAG TPA: alkaline phosphatase family protein [Burkholderiaceae bacterium]|nr:alkaline phosphatase family protein [Burkholderiaceae bacterium]
MKNIPSLKLLATVAAIVTLASNLSGCSSSDAATQTQYIPTGAPHLDHVWVVMMENHGYGQIVGNPNAPYINQLLNSSNVANNYFAVGHPSLTNYLEVVGGSNFGVQSDNNTDWHNATCQSNIVAGTNANESSSARICPISGTGMDAATPAIDYTNEVTGTPGNPATGAWNIDGTASFGSANTVGQSIADQLATAGLSWRSYQENLPIVGADKIDNSDGLISNADDLKLLSNPQPTASNVVALYASKHNPFVYFQNVQQNGLSNIHGFDGIGGLYADLATGNVPAYSFIAPNQCNDMHGKSGAGVFCAGDPNDNGTQTGLNPGLIYRGDQSLQKLVNNIKGSPVWTKGNNAIVVLWDENDYSVNLPNHVVSLVVKNYGTTAAKSNVTYNHFSVLKTIEAGFGLPCLNHACDASVSVMTDLFN